MILWLIEKNKYIFKNFKNNKLKMPKRCGFNKVALYLNGGVYLINKYGVLNHF